MHVELVGVAYGVKTDGGILDFVTREVEVECLPTAIPHEIPLDVTELHIGQHIEAASSRCRRASICLDDPKTRHRLGQARQDRGGRDPGRRRAEAAVDRGAAEPEVIAKGKKEEAKES